MGIATCMSQQLFLNPLFRVKTLHALQIRFTRWHSATCKVGCFLLALGSKIAGAGFVSCPLNVLHPVAILFKKMGLIISAIPANLLADELNTERWYASLFWVVWPLYSFNIDSAAFRSWTLLNYGIWNVRLFKRCLIYKLHFYFPLYIGEKPGENSETQVGF